MSSPTAQRLARLEPERLEADPVGAGRAADGHEQLVGLDARAVVERDREGAVARDAASPSRRGGRPRRARAATRAPARSRTAPRARSAARRGAQRHLRAERAPGLRHLDADDAAAEDREPRRHLAAPSSPCGSSTASRRAARGCRARAPSSRSRRRRPRRASALLPLDVDLQLRRRCAPRPRTSVTPCCSSQGSCALSSRSWITSSRRASTAAASIGPTARGRARAAPRWRARPVAAAPSTACRRSSEQSPPTSACSTIGHGEAVLPEPPGGHLAGRAGADHHNVEFAHAPPVVGSRGDRYVSARRRAVVLLAHQRAREHEVRGRAVAGDRHVVDDGDAQQRLDVDVVRVRLERIPEEDHEVDAALGDRRAHLLVAAERAAQEAVHGQAELARELGAGRAGRVELVLRERAAVVRAPTRACRPCGCRARSARAACGGASSAARRPWRAPAGEGGRALTIDELRYAAATASSPARTAAAISSRCARSTSAAARSRPPSPARAAARRPRGWRRVARHGAGDALQQLGRRGRRPPRGRGRRGSRRRPGGRRAGRGRPSARPRARARAGSGPRARGCRGSRARPRSRSGGRRRSRRGGTSGRPGCAQNGSATAPPIEHAAERQVAARDALREHDHVGLDVPALVAEPGADAAERADHAVDHEQHAVALADRGDGLDVAPGAPAARRPRRSRARRRRRRRWRRPTRSISASSASGDW